MNNTFDDEWATIGTSEFLSEEAFLEAARAFATTTYNRYLQAANKSIFVDKTPRYYHILDFIEALCPKARKIWLKRNPLDVALSYVNSWGVGMDVIVGQQVAPASFDFAIGPFSLADYFDQPSPLKMELQYEAVVQDPVAALVQVCDFLGVHYEDGMLDYIHDETVLAQYDKSMVGDDKVLATSSVHSRSIGKWQTGLQVAEIQQVVDLLGFDLLKRMGYDDTVATLQSMGITVTSESEAAEARRRVADAGVDKMAQLYDEVAALRKGTRGTLVVARFLRKTRLDRLLGSVSR